EVEDLRKEVQRLQKNGAKLKASRDDLKHIENLVDRLVNEEQTLNLDLDAPTEFKDLEPFKVLEPAQILHAQAKARMAMMIAGAALASFALALLAVSWWEFRRRRIDAVEDVAQDLGLRVVGALPHAARRVPRRLRGGNSRDTYVDLLLT